MLPTGYGQASRLPGPGQNPRYAHRAAWELAHGRPVPDGMDVCHSCDVRHCVNPAHLFIGTAKDNIQDSIRKGRQFAWQRTGFRLDGRRAKRRPVPTAQRQLDALLEPVAFRQLPILGDVA